jgi:DNA polymerase phi
LSVSRSAARTDDLHYRLRVVDLLDSLVKQRLANPLLVLVVLPLFRIAKQAVAVEEELQSKATKLLRLIVRSRKDPPSPASPEASLEALAELHIMSRTVDSPELANLCSQACIYLVKSALASTTADASTSNSIATIYADSFKLYLSKKNSKTRVQPLMTIDFAKRSPACAWNMLSVAVELAGGVGVNAFRRMQAFEVAQALLISYAALVSHSLLTQHIELL